MPHDTADHYAVLGVPPDASATEIRAAYRTLARRHHPDRSPTESAAMAAVNEAYRVLGDPGRRAVYDAARRAPRGPTAATVPPTPVASRPVVMAPLPPARVPWRLVLIMFGIGALGVLVLAALARPSNPPPPDNLIDAGSCVVVEANGDAREVTCATGDATVRVVRSLVASAPECPSGTDAHRDRQGRGIACLEPPGATLPEA